MHLHVLRVCAALLAIGLFIVACESADRPVPYSEVETSPAPVAPGQSNTNATNPILTVALNSEIVEGVDPVLVWSD